MEFDSEQIADTLFEIASEQRVRIITNLHDKRYTVSKLAKKLGATVPEVSRNFERLKKAGIIVKNNDNSYQLTTYGQSLYCQLPSLVFVPQYGKYFTTHSFGSLPTKFIQRIGQLNSGIQVKGFVKTMEKLKDIYKNSNEYIYNILTEVSYEKEIVDTLISKLENGIQVKSIFVESAIVPEERKKVVAEIDFEKFVEAGVLERKMRRNTDVALTLNEKEAGVMFSSNEGEIDVSQMLYSDDPEFHEWCLDYFRYCQDSAASFRENKLR